MLFCCLLQHVQLPRCRDASAAYDAPQPQQPHPSSGSAPAARSSTTSSSLRGSQRGSERSTSRSSAGTRRTPGSSPVSSSSSGNVSSSQSSGQLGTSSELSSSSSSSDAPTSGLGTGSGASPSDSGDGGGAGGGSHESVDRADSDGRSGETGGADASVDLTLPYSMELGSPGESLSRGGLVDPSPRREGGASASLSLPVDSMEVGLGAGVAELVTPTESDGLAGTSSSVPPPEDSVSASWRLQLSSGSATSSRPQDSLGETVQPVGAGGDVPAAPVERDSPIDSLVAVAVSPVRVDQPAFDLDATPDLHSGSPPCSPELLREPEAAADEEASPPGSVEIGLQGTPSPLKCPLPSPRKRPREGRPVPGTGVDTTPDLALLPARVVGGAVVGGAECEHDVGPEDGMECGGDAASQTSFVLRLTQTQQSQVDTLVSPPPSPVPHLSGSGVVDKPAPDHVDAATSQPVRPHRPVPVYESLRLDSVEESVLRHTVSDGQAPSTDHAAHEPSPPTPLSEVVSPSLEPSPPAPAPKVTSPPGTTGGPSQQSVDVSLSGELCTCSSGWWSVNDTAIM